MTGMDVKSGVRALCLLLMLIMSGCAQLPLPPPPRMQAQASSLRPGDNAGLPSTDPKAPAIILSNWWCGIIGLAGASVYYVLYDQVGNPPAACWRRFPVAAC